MLIVYEYDFCFIPDAVFTLRRLQEKHRQPPNLKRMLVKCIFSRIPTLVGNSKCMKPRCQVYDILDTQNKLQIPGTSSTILPGNYNCNSCSIVYLLM